VTLEQALAELDTMARAQDGVRSGGDPAQRWHVEVAALARVYRSGYAETLYMLLGAVGFVLLIASVNVANLQLNRGVTREAEMATRLALGAGRWRLFRQLVVENSTLALIGGALGVLVALVGIRLFVLLAPDFYPPSEEIGLNATVLLFMLAVCTVTGILSGLVPGLRASKPDIHPSLRQGGRGAAGHMRLGVRRVLVAAEIALAMVLLVGAGLMINSYARAMSVPMGLDPDNVLGMQVSLMGMDRYRTRHATDHWAATPEVSRFYTQVLDRLAALPGVDAVGLTSVLPPGNGQVVPFRAIGGEGPAAGSAAQYHEVSADFFTTLRIPLLRGRAFSEGDQQTTEGVMVVNEAFARRFLDGADPVGQLIQADLTGSNAALTPDRVRQVVGVVGDVRMGLRAELLPVMYVPYRQHLTDYPTPFALGIHSIVDVVVRTSSRPATVAAAVRRIVADVDPDVAVDGLAPMRATLSAEAGAQAFWMRLLGIFAALGVFLAAIGIYGVVSYSVEQRKHEFGIRAALGAHGRDLLTLVLREGLGVTLIGLAVGIGGAFVSTRLIENQLFGVTRMDPMTIVAVALLLLAVSLLACYVPGRRSAKLDPLVALRAE
jgi:putative ABC transport system permease protein